MSKLEILKPRESGKYIADNAKYVQIKYAGIKRLGDEVKNEKLLKLLKATWLTLEFQVVTKINSGELSVDLFSQAAIHPKSTDAWAQDWLFVVDTLNFCFWSREHEEGWTVDGYTGYFALCAAINRAMKEKVDILNPKFYSTITHQQAESLFRSDNQVKIPLFEERITSLHEVGSILFEKFDGSFDNVVKQAEKSAVKLLQLIVQNFPCFRDEAVYKGKNIAIYKRAQILVGDIWACHKGKDVGEFVDIDEITMFADYRVPQSLLDFGVFEYTDDLLQRLKQTETLPNGDEMEVEIRGCSIHAVELIKDYVNKILPEGKKANGILLDHFLWDYRRQHAKQILQKKLPFHKTYCVYY